MWCILRASDREQSSRSPGCMHDTIWSLVSVWGEGGKRGLPRMSKSQWCAAAMQKRSSCRRSNLTYLVPSRAFSPQVSASGGCINLARLQLAAIGKHNHNRALLYGSHFSLSLSFALAHTRALTPTPHFNNGIFE
jgi:hypothetical protein